MGASPENAEDPEQGDRQGLPFQPRLRPGTGDLFDRLRAMSEYEQFKNKIRQRLDLLEGAIGELESLKLVDPKLVARWREHMDAANNSLRDSLLRVAVVGSVKSGKSTLINTLLGKDLLRRGAGITTAVITRIRSNSEAGGWIELKSWPQVAEELNAALRLLPYGQHELEGGAELDVRRSEDRARLAVRLENIRRHWQRTSGNLDPYFLLLNSFLDGYQQLHGTIGDTVKRLVLDDDSLEHHQRFVGPESQAVYVRDIELHYPVAWLGEQLEIADCQGSDSPNPLHLATVQQYLLRSHLLLYVISSRSGLREADFKLLDLLKTLRMLSQTFFVLNIDLDTHPHAEDLADLVHRVRSELAWVVSNPRLYAFSALFHLLEAGSTDDGDRNRHRLDLWKSDTKLCRVSEQGYRAFREDLSLRIGRQRTRLLLGSGLSRNSLVAAGVLDQVRARESFLDCDPGSIDHASKLIEKRQTALQEALATLGNAITGLQESVRRELDGALDAFFDAGGGPLVAQTLEMVEHYPVDPHYQRNMAELPVLVRQLHHFYVEFRLSLARYLIETVNLRIIEFAREQETFLRERLSQASRALWSLFATVLAEYRKDLSRLAMDRVAAATSFEDFDWPHLDETAPPSFTVFLDAHAVGRGTLLLKFGLGHLSGILTSLKNRVGRRGEESAAGPGQNRALLDAIALVKAETKSELLLAFRDYRRNFRAAYLHRLLEKGARHLLERFKARAEMTRIDLDGLLKQCQLEGEGRQQMIEALARIAQVTEAMIEELDSFRCVVNLDWTSGEQGPQAGECPGSRQARASSE